MTTNHKRISELTELLAPANDDLLAIVDNSETTTKKISVANLLTLVPPAGTGLPAGNNTYVQYNDGGIFGGDSNFIWDRGSALLSITGKIYAQDYLKLGGGTPAYIDLVGGDVYLTDELEVAGKSYLAGDVYLYGSTYFNGNFMLNDGVRNYLGMKTSVDDGAIIFTGADMDSYCNRNIIITDYSNIAKNHDHSALSDNPTLYIHSVTNPDTDNTQWISIHHNQANAVYRSGKGGIIFVPNNELITEKYVEFNSATSPEIYFKVYSHYGIWDTWMKFTAYYSGGLTHYTRVETSDDFNIFPNNQLLTGFKLWIDGGVPFLQGYASSSLKVMANDYIDFSTNYTRTISVDGYMAWTVDGLYHTHYTGLGITNNGASDYTIATGNDIILQPDGAAPYGFTKLGLSIETIVSFQDLTLTAYGGEQNRLWYQNAGSSPVFLGFYVDDTNYADFSKSKIDGTFNYNNTHSTNFSCSTGTIGLNSATHFGYEDGSGVDVTFYSTTAGMLALWDAYENIFSAWTLQVNATGYLYFYGNLDPNPLWSIQGGSELAILATGGTVSNPAVHIYNRTLITFPATNATYTGSSLIINPATVIAGSALFWAGVNNTYKFIIESDGDISLIDGGDFTLGTSSGTKFGTGVSQKLSFFNATPIVQQAQTVDLKDLLVNFGFYAAPAGTTPLNLDGGAFICGGIEIDAKIPTLTLTDNEVLHDDYTISCNTSIFSIANKTDSVTAFQIAGTGGITFNAGADYTITITDSNNFVFNTGNGTKIGTGTSQKLAFYNSTPIIQSVATTDLGTVLSDLGLRAVGTAYPITTSGIITVSGKFIGTPTTVTVTSSGVAIPITNLDVEVTTDGDSDEDNGTLAAGTAGQIINIYVKVQGNAADSFKITPATMIGGTKVSFAAPTVGKGATMVYTASGWACIGTRGGVVS